MTLLDQITTKRDEPKPRILLYGREKGGKTTFASEFPNNLIIDIEGGATNIETTKFSGTIDENGKRIPPTPKDVYDLLCEIEESETDFQYITIDSIDWLADAIATGICAQPENKAAKGIGDNAHKPFAYGQGHAQVALKVNAILNKLEDLRLNKGICPILIAHTKVKPVETPLDAKYDKFELKLSNAVGSKVKEWVDCILFLKDKFYTTQEGKTANPEMWIFAEANPAYEGGGRYDIKNFKYTKGEGYNNFIKQLSGDK